MSEPLQPTQFFLLIKKKNNDVKKNVSFFGVTRGFIFSAHCWMFGVPCYFIYVFVCVLERQTFLAVIELELQVFKYTWRRGLHEYDPVLDGEQLWAVSCVGTFDCSVRGFHQPLPLSLRHSPLPPCFQLHFTRCNKAFILSPCCLGCFAAPLHCSPSVKAKAVVSECVQLFDVRCYVTVLICISINLY